MTSRQISFISMYRRVLNFLRKKYDVTKNLPGFADVLDSFESNLNAIIRLGNEQGTDIRGLRAQKVEIKTSTGEKALDMSHRVEAFAKMTGNVVLAKKIHYTDSDVFRTSDYEFLTACTIIVETSEAYKDELVTYGVTPESLTDLKSSIAEWKDVMDSPKEGYTGKKQATTQLTDLFATQTGYAEKMDALIELLRYSNVPFYNEYQDTRKVVYRKGSITVKCEVTDMATGAPLVGATVNFSVEGVLVIEKTTSANGLLTIKSMNDGAYTVTVSRLGYVTQVQNVNVMNVELTTVKVALDASTSLSASASTTLSAGSKQ